MAETHLLRLFVIFLGICSLLCSNAVKTTQGGDLIHGRARVFETALGDTNLVETEEKVIFHGGGRGRRRRRVKMELNDYPGSGANNRHTPRPPFGRGCIDC